MTMVAGQLKNMVSTIIGAIVFDDFVFAWANVLGLSISMIGKSPSYVKFLVYVLF